MVNATAMVEKAEVTVQFVNPPKPGKKWGSIKDTLGNYYGGPPALLAKFQPGETCTLEYVLGGTDGTLKAIKQKVEIPQVLQKAVKPMPRAPTNPDDSERMGTQGMVQAFIAVGAVQLQRDAIKNAMQVCNDAYNDFWGTPEMQTSKHEFNDEIPGF